MIKIALGLQSRSVSVSQELGCLHSGFNAESLHFQDHGSS